MSEKQYTPLDMGVSMAGMAFSVATFTLLFGLSMLFGMTKTKQDQHKRPF